MIVRMSRLIRIGRIGIRGMADGALLICSTNLCMIRANRIIRILLVRSIRVTRDMFIPSKSMGLSIIRFAPIRCVMIPIGIISMFVVLAFASTSVLRACVVLSQYDCLAIVM